MQCHKYTRELKLKVRVCVQVLWKNAEQKEHFLLSFFFLPLIMFVSSLHGATRLPIFRSKTRVSLMVPTSVPASISDSMHRRSVCCAVFQIFTQYSKVFGFFFAFIFAFIHLRFFLFLGGVGLCFHSCCPCLFDRVLKVSQLLHRLRAATVDWVAVMVPHWRFSALQVTEDDLSMASNLMRHFTSLKQRLTTCYRVWLTSAPRWSHKCFSVP